MPLVYQDISSALQDDKRRSFHCQGGAEGLPLSFDDPCLHHADSHTLVSFMLWITLVLYTKWNWGVHVTDRKVRSRNNMQMLLLLILLFLLATIL